MSLNYTYVLSLFFLLLVTLNLYFFITLSAVMKPKQFFVPHPKIVLRPSIFKDILDHLNYLPSQYKTKNTEFISVQKNTFKYFNTTSNIDINSVWQDVRKWDDDFTLFPQNDGVAGRILQAIRTAQITLVDNAPKGTQLKLLLLLEGKQKLYFKPKRYNITDIIRGKIYAGFDRHNAEVLAYYLAVILNFKWIPPSTIRKIHISKDVSPLATIGLNRTMVINDKGSICIYGKCFYCKVNDSVCPNKEGVIEGAAILYLDKKFNVHKSPWRRSYTSKKMEWEKDNNYCVKVKSLLSTRRILELIDIAIFDFLIQNGDRHRYEVYKNKVLLIDNGKGLGNPMVDEMDILAPLYQCCILKLSTMRNLELITGGSLTETIKLLSSIQGDTLATEDHYRAIERRLLKVFAAIQYCVGKYGSANVFKTNSEIY